MVKVLDYSLNILGNVINCSFNSDHSVTTLNKIT